VLTNRKYLGELVGNRTQAPLGSAPVARPEASWVRKPMAFQAIVSRRLFDAARARIARLRPVHMSDEEMRDALRAIYARHGKITYQLIDAAERLPGSDQFKRQFGGQAGWRSRRLKRPPWRAAPPR
jgi:hypothetical protein